MVGSHHFAMQAPQPADIDCQRPRAELRGQGGPRALLSFSVSAFAQIGGAPPPRPYYIIAS